MNLDLNARQVAKEYFEIRNILSQNNKIRNEVFELRYTGEEHFIIIKSSRADHGLRLATYDKANIMWKIFHSNDYSNFYKYMFKRIYLLKSLDDILIGNELTNWLNRLWVV